MLFDIVFQNKVNIPSNVNDPNYRYQRPILDTKFERQGKQKQTILLNLPAVAKALRIKPKYILNFFGQELRAKTERIPKKKGGKAQMIIYGNFEVEVLNQLLDSFIEKYTICPRCKLPECFIEVETILYLNCNACGQRSKTDKEHRTSQFMIKKPPRNQDLFEKANIKI